MSASGLSSRAIIGQFYHALEQNDGAAWVNPLSMLFNSDQESETYKWLGASPAMREWIGGRNAKGLRENGISIANKKFEATLEIPVDWLRRDKTGQINVRINEMARRTNAHWASLLSTLIIAGESAVCYDGEYFFDTDHPGYTSAGDLSGSQSNDISLDVTTTTAPTATEMQTAILNAIQAMYGFVDDQGQPLNEDASDFTVMVPVPFLQAAGGALGATVISQTSNMIQAVGSLGGFNVNLAVNPRLSWTTKLAVFRADGDVSPFIRQEEEGVTVSAIAEGSEKEFTDDVHLYGVKALRNVGYGYWQKACLVTLT
jgi:phage major head subunit gpT-like protein